MNNEPLTKEKVFINNKWCLSSDVRSAVELLKEKIGQILEVGGIENPLVQDDAEWVLSQIDLCFPVFSKEGK